MNGWVISLIVFGGILGCFLLVVAVSCMTKKGMIYYNVYGIYKPRSQAEENVDLHAIMEGLTRRPSTAQKRENLKKLQERNRAHNQERKEHADDGYIPMEERLSPFYSGREVLFDDPPEVPARFSAGWVEIEKNPIYDQALGNSDWVDVMAIAPFLRESKLIVFKDENRNKERKLVDVENPQEKASSPNSRGEGSGEGPLQAVQPRNSFLPPGGLGNSARGSQLESETIMESQGASEYRPRAVTGIHGLYGGLHGIGPGLQANSPPSPIPGGARSHTYKI